MTSCRDTILGWSSPDMMAASLFKVFQTYGSLILERLITFRATCLFKMMWLARTTLLKDPLPRVFGVSL